MDVVSTVMRTLLVSKFLLTLLSWSISELACILNMWLWYWPFAAQRRINPAWMVGSYHQLPYVLYLAGTFRSEEASRVPPPWSHYESPMERQRQRSPDSLRRPVWRANMPFLHVLLPGNNGSPAMCLWVERGKENPADAAQTKESSSINKPVGFVKNSSHQRAPRTERRSRCWLAVSSAVLHFKSRGGAGFNTGRHRHRSSETRHY